MLLKDVEWVFWFALSIDPSQAYIKGESSDWIVKEVLSKKEHLLFFNPKGKGNGALLRNALTKELEDNFNAFAAFRSIFFVIVW